MRDLLQFMVIAVFILTFVVGVIWLSVRRHAEFEQHRAYVRECIIANRELPQSDLYCEALWNRGER